MGLYNKAVLESTTISSVLPAIEDIQESSMDSMNEASMQAIYENEVNYQGLMKAVGIEEAKCDATTGQDFLSEASNASGFFGKIKEFFVKLWEKIVAIFKKFIALMNSYIMSDKDFVNKYRDALLKANTKDFKFKGYEYTTGVFDFTKLNTTNSNITDVIDDKNFGDALSVAEVNGDALDATAKKYFTDNKNAIETGMRNFNSKRSDISEAVRGAVLAEIGDGASKGKKYTNSEFEERIHEVLRNNKSEKEEIENIQVAKYLGIIVDYKKDKKTAEDAMKTFKKTIDDVLKQLDKASKELGKNVPSSADKNIYTTIVSLNHISYGLYKEVLEDAQKVLGMTLAAMKEENRQAKSICAGLLGHRPKNESGMLDESSYEGSLAGFTMV